MTPLVLHLPPFLQSQGKARECRLCLCAAVETLKSKSTAQTSPQDHRQPVLSQSSQLRCAPPTNLVEFGLVGNKTLGLRGVSMIGRSARR